MLGAFAYAQDLRLTFSGRVIDESTGVRLDGVRIEVKGRKSYYTKHGKFRSDEFKPGNHFTLVFSKPGYIPKRVEVDSEKEFYPEDWGPDTNIEMELSMYKADRRMDYKNFPGPAARFKISPSSGKLDIDSGYGAKIKQQSTAFLTKQSEFLKLFGGAQKDQKNGAYADGLNKMEKALLLFRDQPRANALHEELTKLAQGEGKQYTAILNKADEYFDQENWDKSEKLYTRATTLKPTDNYPKKRLRLIDEKRKVLVVETTEEQPAETTKLIERTNSTVASIPEIERESQVGKDLLNQKEKWMAHQKEIQNRERIHQEYVSENHKHGERVVREYQPSKINPKERTLVEYIPPTYQQRERGIDQKAKNSVQKVERKSIDLAKMREMMETASKKQEARAEGNND